MNLESFGRNISMKLALIGEHLGIEVIWQKITIMIMISLFIAIYVLLMYASKIDQVMEHFLLALK